MTSHSTAFASTDYGRVIAPDAVRIERLLPGPIERVWSYLTEENKRRLWMASGTIGSSEGATVEHVFRHSELTTDDDQPPQKYVDHAGEVRKHGHVLAWDPPRLLAYSWEEGTDTPSEVRFELSPRGDKVLLIVTHTRIANRGIMTSFSAGWHVHLDLLRDLLEGEQPSAFWSKFTKLEQEYEARIPNP
ncbi:MULTISPECIES: SRPBCC family protein [unclassified Ensifer]|uniref:SRPBCC family protein n=1 Tax=unclassified Ensifer TaxID=2633371 RepID=UPI0008138717|nr:MULTISPECIES: SRPBCC family protein [unclassified Ensifer]OCP09278.1 ATPase [Ensifer sp. LC13]OCP10459.1 ATPase [Ensifer sp. LC11]OCP13934.1 ATPase [Ensifer sp. LC14]OCP32526.1 ATPase [Ensifer sp. LC499]